jgi:hypothetical protein
MTKEDWKYIQDHWGQLFHSIEMKIDGYNVSLSAFQSGMKIQVAIYVNGSIIGKNLIKDEDGNYPEISRRFYLLNRRGLHSQKDLKAFAKIWGKKHKYAQQTYYEWITPHYTSFVAFKKTIINNNNDIQLIRNDNE